MSFEKYFLDDTPGGHARLAILNGLYNPHTLQALQRAGLGAGMRVLELGTGAGILTGEIARIVGPSGSVLSVDRSSAQVQALSGAGAGLPANVEVRQLAVSELDRLDETFDFVFARWILLHMTDTLAGVGAMARRVRPGGTLALEDCVTRTAFCYPRSPAFEQFLQGWLEVSRREHIAPNAGDELLSLFDQVGFSVERLSYHQPLLQRPAERMLPALSLSESRDIHVRNGVFASTEIDSIVGDLEKLQRSGHAMGFVRNTFVAGAPKG